AVANRLRTIEADVTVRAPRANRYTRNISQPSPVAQSQFAETIAAAAPERGKSWNWPLVACLAAALVAVAWLYTARSRQQQVYSQTERLLVAAVKDTSQPLPVRQFAAKS